jgi:hypothetical protein
MKRKSSGGIVFSTNPDFNLIMAMNRARNPAC